ncbi:hypothetical protein IJG79_02060 [Candidatus Saccharibacteria bacterium]|nr:hypothetical protein [Candidatus Saccharibacteria bacterium]
MFYYESYTKKHFRLVPLWELKDCISGGRAVGRRKRVIEIYMHEKDLAQALNVTELNIKNFNLYDDASSTHWVSQINGLAQNNSGVCGIITGVSDDHLPFVVGYDNGGLRSVALYNVPCGFESAMLRSRVVLLNWGEDKDIPKRKNLSHKNTIAELKNILKV